jgi:hypothetical protein
LFPAASVSASSLTPLCHCVLRLDLWVFVHVWICLCVGVCVSCQKENPRWILGDVTRHRITVARWALAMIDTTPAHDHLHRNVYYSRKRRPLARVRPPSPRNPHRAVPPSQINHSKRKGSTPRCPHISGQCPVYFADAFGAFCFRDAAKLRAHLGEESPIFRVW